MIKRNLELLVALIIQVQMKYLLNPGVWETNHGTLLYNMEFIVVVSSLLRKKNRFRYALHMGNGNEAILYRFIELNKNKIKVLGNPLYSNISISKHDNHDVPNRTIKY